MIERDKAKNQSHRRIQVSGIAVRRDMKTSKLLSIGSGLWLLLLRAVSVHGQACDSRTGKCDTHERCPVWADEGECLSSTKYMLRYCPGSCGNLAQQRMKEREMQNVHDQPLTCEDKLERCSVYAELGECEANPDKMNEFCRQSCGLCDEKDDDEESCQNYHEKCEDWSERGECERNAHYMERKCPRACGKCGSANAAANVPKVAIIKEELTPLEKIKDFGELQVAEGVEAAQTLERIESTLTYMQSEEVLNLPDRVRTRCKNRHELCTFWAVIGECEKNAAWMTTNCAPACRSCPLIDFNARCPPLPAGTPPALKPGDLDAMFTRIISTAPGNQTESSTNPDIPPYTVTVHSSPEDNGRPWIITFDGFITPEEADALIQHGYEEEYKRSEDVGAQKFDGSYDSKQSESRTSENAWCSAFKGCRWAEVPTRILDRISVITGIPPNNSEDLQILKYESGQCVTSLLWLSLYFTFAHSTYFEMFSDSTGRTMIISSIKRIENADQGFSHSFFT